MMGGGEAPSELEISSNLLVFKNDEIMSVDGVSESSIEVFVKIYPIRKGETKFSTILVNNEDF